MSSDDEQDEVELGCAGCLGAVVGPAVLLFGIVGSPLSSDLPEFVGHLAFAAIAGVTFFLVVAWAINRVVR